MTGYPFCVATGIDCMFGLAEAMSETRAAIVLMRESSPKTQLGLSALHCAEALLEEVADAYDGWRDKVNKEIAQ